MSKKELKPELLTVGKLFTDNYLIPIYQRNYAWRAEQIEQLISDIQDSVVGGRDNYFLGNLVVIKRGREDEFEVIDGQQRLTTLYLLLTFTEQDGEVRSRRLAMQATCNMSRAHGQLRPCCE